MTDRPALLVVNPKCRRGRIGAGCVARTLHEAGVTVLVRSCERAGDLSDLIRRSRSDVESVIIGGGDGTLNAATAGILDTGLPLGIIPLGTANDLARTLAIPSDPAMAARAIAAGKTQRVDLGVVNGHPFFNVAHIGFGVDLTRALTREAKQRFGPLGYAVAALRALSTLNAFRVEIIHGKTTELSRTVHVAIGNGRYYGSGMTVAEHARIDDGRLHLYSLEVTTFWRLLLLLPALRTGRHERWHQIRTLEGEAVEIRTHSRPRSVCIDGEIVARTPAYFSVLLGAVRIFVP